MLTSAVRVAARRGVISSQVAAAAAARQSLNPFAVLALRPAVAPARSFTTSPDGRTHTFVLRDGIKLHDGAELTAADVKRSIERALHPKTACPGASNYAAIEGFDAFHGGKAGELAGAMVGAFAYGDTALVEVFVEIILIVA